MDDEAGRRLELESVGAATNRLLVTAARLADADMRAPSLLPGWTRGHVLTHIARNADGLARLLRWARTGIETPMYASAAARAADIDAGADRPAATLAADVGMSAGAFAGEASSMRGDAWAAQVRALQGPAFPACGVLQRRLSEVEIHHVDLAADYRPGDWPAEFVADALPRVAGSFAGRADAPPFLLWAEGWPDGFRIGPDQQSGEPRLTVRGPPAALLAWLLGRNGGSGLRVSGDAAGLPVLPPWR